MRDYNIWVEGYRATGESATAMLVGKSAGNDFDHAVDRFMVENPSRGIEKTNHYITINGIKHKTNSKCNYNIWACGLYPTLFEAQKSFG